MAASPGSGRFMASLASNWKAMVGGAIVGFFVLVAVFGPWFVGDPIDFVTVPLSPPSADHWFGSTGQGQDVLAQTVVGAQTTLLVALVVGFFSVLLGALVGVTAGFFGGRVDTMLSLLLNVFLVIPGLPLAIILAAYLPTGPFTLGAVLIVTGWAWNARVVRGLTLSLRKQDFVSAAVVSGEARFRILVREILPNQLSLLVSQFIGATVYAIGAQVGLEFLGLGDVNTVTWGTNLYWAVNDQALLTESWWTFVPTGLAVALTGFGLVMLNFAVDEVTNPRLASDRIWRTALKGRDIVLDGGATPVVRGGRAGMSEATEVRRG